MLFTCKAPVSPKPFLTKAWTKDELVWNFRNKVVYESDASLKLYS